MRPIHFNIGSWASCCLELIFIDFACPFFVCLYCKRINIVFLICRFATRQWIKGRDDLFDLTMMFCHDVVDFNEYQRVWNFLASRALAFAIDGRFGSI